MIKKGYKVVNYDGSSLIYINAAVIYEIDRSTFPKKDCGPLTVFTNLKAAIYFKNRMLPPIRIFSCYYIRSQHEEVWYPCTYSLTQRVSLERLLQQNHSCILPNSVDLADEVILTEEL